MLIGINGFKSAGKDTVGEYLAEQYDFKKASFAALLKQSAGALFDIDPNIWETIKNMPEVRVMITHTKGHSDYKLANLSAREFLQRYGTESHRDVFGYDFWVEQAFKSLDATEDNKYVFTDVRFENELVAIKSKGGFNIQVIRDETDKEAGDHVSEVRPDPSLIDFVVENNGTRDELYDKIDEIMVELGVLV